MNKVEISDKIDLLETELINMLVSKHLICRGHGGPLVEFVSLQESILKTINEINAYYVLLNSY